jgi:tripartite ATP-independent transporter DctP family solute receptor
MPKTPAVLGFVLALGLWAALPPTGGALAEQRVTIRAAQVLADTHPSHQALLRMADILSERSGGELGLDILDGNALGGERDLIESIQMGEADLIVIGTAPLYGFTSDFLVFDLPYLFPDLSTARAVMDSPFARNRLDNAIHAGLKGLGYYENGLRHISSSKTPVLLPGDLKGMRIRTMESRIHLETFRALGASPVPLSYSDLYDRLKNGSIEAEENPVSVFVTGKFYEVQDYYSLTGHFYMPSPMFVSNSLWNKLDRRDQELLLEAARESARYQRELSDAFYTKEALDELSERITLFRDIDRGPWRKAVAPVRKIFEAEVGAQTLKELDRAIAEAGVGPRRKARH